MLSALLSPVTHARGLCAKAAEFIDSSSLFGMIARRPHVRLSMSPCIGHTPPAVRNRYHFTHNTFSMLSALGARELFEKLRHSYNRMELGEAAPVPPFDEWGGILTICDHVFCRCVLEFKLGCTELLCI